MNSLLSGWVETTIGQVFSVVGGGTPSTSVESNWVGNIPWISSADISDQGEIAFRRVISLEAVDRSAANLVPDGSVIVVTRVGLGKVAKAPCEMAFSQDCQALLPIPGIEPEFLRLQLSKTALSLKAVGRGTTISGVTKKQLLSLPIIIPPTAEQKRIVSAIQEQFSRLDVGIIALRRTQQNLRRMRSAVLQAGVMGSDQGFSESPSELPASWHWVTLESVLADGKASFRRGPFGSALTKAIFVDSGYKVYEQYCPINDDCSFGRYYISAQRYEELKGFAVEAGDFLVSCSGSIGRITQVPKDFEPGVINQALLRIRTNKEIILDAYFLALFRSPYFQQQILANSIGTAMVNVKGVRELKAIPIPLPPIEEQGNILDRLASWESSVSALESSLIVSERRSGALRSSILAAAFSGQLTTQDPNDESASVLLERIVAERASPSNHQPTRRRMPRASREKVTG